MYKTLKSVIAAFGAALLVGCGGGGGDATPTLSATQKNFVSSAVNNAYTGFNWSLPTTNVAPVNGTHFFVSQTYALTASPETGVQNGQQTTDNLTTTLSLPINDTTVIRYLKNSAVYLSGGKVEFSFVGDNVHTKSFAQDNITLVEEEEFDSWSTPISLSGAIADSDELRRFYGFSRLNLPTYFTKTTPWRAGSTYITRSRVQKNQQIQLIDWSSRTYDINVVPWSGAQTTIETMFAYVTSTFGGVTVLGTVYQLGDGQITSKERARMWVSSNKISSSSKPTDSYVCFIELNGKIYLGYLTKENTRQRVIDGIDNTIILDYTIRFNATATQSIKDAVNF